MGIKQGDLVSVHYTGTLDDGSVFDSSRGCCPLTFKAGTGQMIKGFDEAVMGMEVGESKKVHIPAAEAYGEHDEARVLQLSKSQIPGIEKAPIGKRLMFSGPDNSPLPGVIVEMDDEYVVVDFNHELSGKDLNFAIEVVSVS